jgi:hypothetical protein
MTSETQFLGIPSFHPLAIIINYHRVVIYGYDQNSFLFVNYFVTSIISLPCCNTAMLYHKHGPTARKSVQGCLLYHL